MFLTITITITITINTVTVDLIALKFYFCISSTYVRGWSVRRSHIFVFPFCQRLWTLTESP